jgi:23S rRNA (cytidine2498-2'-O)-methyltransferase
MRLNRLILTADPDVADLAVAELQAALPGASVVAWLEPGVALVDLPTAFQTLAAQWRAVAPIFVRHICPVDFTIPLFRDLADLDALTAAVTTDFVAEVDPDQTLSVQTRLIGDLPYKPFDVNTRLARLLEEEGKVAINVRAPDQILSILCTTDTAYLGLSAALDNLSDWAGGMRRFAREEGQISRAEFKLLEAFEIFALDLAPNGVALDLGAAPGGWTRVLRQRAQYVTAVDPAELDPRLAADRYVRHKRMTAEQYLAAEPDTFDLIVNDMRMDARDSARLMVAYARQLYPHGAAIMTLKLPHHDRRAVIDQSLKLLGRAYRVAGARHLFHNRSEITLYLLPLARAS